MFHLQNPVNSGKWLIAVALLTTPMLVLPVQAHQVEVSGSVGGTLHLEPNDSPRAGTSSLAWFALRQRNGQSIPLASCNCQLAIYDQSGAVVSRPGLRSVSAENYQGIPGADVTFPRAGAYELVLTGQPTTAGAFSPFELRFSVTVAQ